MILECFPCFIFYFFCFVCQHAWPTCARMYVYVCACLWWCVKEWEKERGDREWAVCHAWEGAKACLNCLLASKPLICKLASLVLSFSLSILSPHVCPLSFHLFCEEASLLSTPISTCSAVFTVTFCHFSTVMHLREQERRLSSCTFTHSQADTQIMVNHTT